MKIAQGAIMIVDCNYRDIQARCMQDEKQVDKTENRRNEDIVDIEYVHQYG